MKIKVVIWSVGCVAIAALFFSELWSKLPGWLTPQGFSTHGVFHWGVLGLCLVWLWLKRKEILPGMKASKLSLSFIPAGMALLALGIFLPRSDDFLICLMLLSWLGVFTIIFGRACVIPSVLLAIYGFTVGFPVLVMDWLGESSAVLMTNIVVAFTRVAGLPITSEGTVLRFNSLEGEAISTVLTPGCVGYATVGVFIALFSLMMLDIRLPFRKAWYVFLIGLAGTWLQNFIRLVLNVTAGYYWGMGGMEAMHHNAAYVIFPLWYAIFAYLYLRQAGWKLSIGRPDLEPASP